MVVSAESLHEDAEWRWAASFNPLLGGSDQLPDARFDPPHRGRHTTPALGRRAREVLADRCAPVDRIAELGGTDSHWAAQASTATIRSSASTNSAGSPSHHVCATSGTIAGPVRCPRSRHFASDAAPLELIEDVVLPLACEAKARGAGIGVKVRTQPAPTGR